MNPDDATGTLKSGAGVTPAGNIALLRSVEDFDGRGGVDLEGHATPGIRRAIRSALDS